MSMEQQLQIMMDRMRQLEEENARTKATNQELTHRVNIMTLNRNTSGGNLNNRITAKTNSLLFENQELQKGMTNETKNFKEILG